MLSALAHALNSKMPRMRTVAQQCFVCTVAIVPDSHSKVIRSEFDFRFDD
jgi:hypothetical protein